MTTSPSTMPPAADRAELSVPPAVEFSMPERVPWSVLGPHFALDWGRADPRHPQPEHIEVIGPTGSGKTYFICTIMQDRVRVRNTAAVVIATKPADATLLRLGWPIVGNWRGVQKNRQCILWPQTRAMGDARRAFHERAVKNVLHRLWVPNSNVLVNLGEIGYLESLSSDMRALVQQYWREGRSQDITVVADKQRPQGVNREMHSETYWTAAFPPADEADLERFAELFGPRRLWMPVFRSLEPTRREFLLRHSRTKQCFITWVDTPLRPLRQRRKGIASSLWARGTQRAA